MQPINVLGEEKMSILLNYDDYQRSEYVEMDAYDIAQSLMAFTDLLVMATHQICGEDVHVNAKVRPFKKGSFESELITTIKSVTGGVITCLPNIELVTNLIKDTFVLIKFLRGEPAKSVVPNKNVHGDVIVENMNGGQLRINNNVYNFTNIPKVREAIGATIAKPLEKDGIDIVSISSNGDELVSTTKEEAQLYVSPDFSQVVHTNIVRAKLIIDMANLSDNKKAKWKFIYEGRKEAFSMEDQVFLDNIENKTQGIYKGDIYDCDIEIRYKQDGLYIKPKDRVIKKVYEVLSSPEQCRLMYP